MEARSGLYLLIHASPIFGRLLKSHGPRLGNPCSQLLGPLSVPPHTTFSLFEVAG